jgi:hypothetical protein
MRNLYGPTVRLNTMVTPGSKESFALALYAAPHLLLTSPRVGLSLTPGCVSFVTWTILGVCVCMYATWQACI